MQVTSLTSEHLLLVRGKDKGKGHIRAWGKTGRIHHRHTRLVLRRPNVSFLNGETPTSWFACWTLSIRDLGSDWCGWHTNCLLFWYLPANSKRYLWHLSHQPIWQETSISRKAEGGFQSTTEQCVVFSPGTSELHGCDSQPFPEPMSCPLSETAALLFMY